MNASMLPSGDKAGVTAESVKLVSGMYSSCCVVGFRDHNSAAAAAATAIATKPAAASHVRRCFLRGRRRHTARTLSRAQSRHQLAHRGISIRRIFLERLHHQGPQMPPGYRRFRGAGSA